jgi:hypothetical protein
MEETRRQARHRHDDHRRHGGSGYRHMPARASMPRMDCPIPDECTVPSDSKDLAANLTASYRRTLVTTRPGCSDPYNCTPPGLVPYLATTVGVTATATSGPQGTR